MSGKVASLPDRLSSFFSWSVSRDTSSPSWNFSLSCRRLTVTNLEMPALMPVAQESNPHEHSQHQRLPQTTANHYLTPAFACIKLFSHALRHNMSTKSRVCQHNCVGTLGKETHLRQYPAAWAFACTAASGRPGILGACHCRTAISDPSCRNHSSRPGPNIKRLLRS